ncbi:uroporphyrinogen-III synthase [Coemansia sp. RSA 552]|nr:uroporphyrinogen-III synthase [Coemansia sp. RSA 552]
MASVARSAVILFRSQERGDSYARELRPHHSIVESVAVLEHQCLLTAADVEQAIGSGDDEVAAVIFTSQNAVSALSHAAAQWIGQASGPRAVDREARWRRFLARPIFVVGRATAAACRTLLLGGCGGDIRGEESGQATVLLPEILQFCRQYRRRELAAPKLVFFCGDQRRDTLPSGIRGNHDAELTEVVAYTTIARTSQAVQSDLVRALDKVAAAGAADGGRGRGGIPVWMVLFSPSGARVAVPIIDDLVRRGVLSATSPPPPDSAGVVYRLAAIGETTASELVALGADEQSISQASEPTERGICEVISRRSAW